MTLKIIANYYEFRDMWIIIVMNLFVIRIIMMFYLMVASELHPVIDDT